MARTTHFDISSLPLGASLYGHPISGFSHIIGMDSDISFRNINRYSTSASVGCPSGLWTSFISAIFSFRYRRARVPSRSTPCLPVIHNWISCGDGESDDDRQRKRPGVLLAISLTPSHHGYGSQTTTRYRMEGMDHAFSRRSFARNALTLSEGRRWIFVSLCSGASPFSHQQRRRFCLMPRLCTLHQGTAYGHSG